MAVRLARPDELKQLPAIEQSAGEAFRGTSQGWVADDDNSPPEFYAPMQADGLVWVADDGKQLIGFGACEAFGPALHLWELAVRLEHQGKGVGRELLAAIFAEGRRRTMNTVTLTTFDAIPWNAPFYARLGFRRLNNLELDERLRAVLAKEASRGLTDRCAMALDL